MSISHDLMLWSQGDLKPSKVDREVAKEARGIYDKARIRAFAEEAEAAIVAKAIEQTCKLIDHAKNVAADDPQKLMLIAPILNRHAMGVEQRQVDRLNGWGW